MRSGFSASACAPSDLPLVRQCLPHAQVCEENGCFAAADPSKVSEQAKKRGLKELGSLGSGNHYTEVQVSR